MFFWCGLLSLLFIVGIRITFGKTPMSQSSLWQKQTDLNDFSELCNGLYQREIGLLAKGDFTSTQDLQAKLKSLPHYIARTASLMEKVSLQQTSPLELDVQNASWAAKQGSKIPLSGQDDASTFTWYLQSGVSIGLAVPVLLVDHIIIDCIDRIDLDKQRLRTNVGGWFSLILDEQPLISTSQHKYKRLLKPNKKVMSSACAGHRWQGDSRQLPIIPSLRELLLSCSINWKNFKKPLAI